MKTAKILVTVLLSALMATGAARAQDDYPNKPIRLVVPVTAGSGLDVRMRQFTQMVSQQLGWNMFIENKPGAGQSIGSAFVAKAPPDGYTLLVINNNIVVNPYLQTNPGYDPFRSFVAITHTMTAPLVLVVNPESGVKTVKDLVALAKSKPEGLNYAHSGLGSTPFFTAELLKLVTGVKAQDVAFKGDGEWLPQLMAGRVDFGFSGPPSSGPLIQAGKVRAVAVTTKVRSGMLPEVPTMAESGYPTYDYPVYVGFLAPAGTPRPIVDKINAAFRKVVQTQEYQQKTRSTGGEPASSTPEEFAALMRSDSKMAGEMVKAIGLKPE